MILTVTPNPALDYTLRVDEIPVGRRAKYRDPALDASGKGVNVARMIRRLGEPVLALGFAAGPTGEILRQGLAREDVPGAFVPVDGLTRINVTLLSGPDGVATHFHGAGGGVAPGDVDRLRSLVAGRLAGARLLVLSGSLPPGMRPADAAALVRLAREAGVPVLLDAEGDVLRAGLAERPAIVKPNLAEAAGLLGRPLQGRDDALRAARELAGEATAIVTLSGEGAVAVRGGRAWAVAPPRETIVRAIGAGDSFAAGLAVAVVRGAALPDALRLAAAAGAATALCPGTGLGRKEDVDRLLAQVAVTEL
jgi:1-phosphofructokinase family hexose kinase